MGLERGDQPQAVLLVPRHDRQLELGVGDLERDPLAAVLDRGAPVYTICVSGARATLAASLLVREGFDARPVIGGGVADLAELGLARTSG